MSMSQGEYSGIWLYPGSGRGEPFSHHEADYDHAEPGGTTPMRHLVLNQHGERVGVWVPASWTDDQAREALETNW
ncbi:hypothetical protein ACFSX5_14855 [Devosia albogilva]|uniref:Uncharacterized protein n=1 Tax=Devosia albogilva TaxID=429726 RepID=A0ABW5QNL7_9HYPH